MPRIKDYTKEDLVGAYDQAGSFDRASFILGINRKTFSKLWKELVGAAPPVDRTGKTAKIKARDDQIHIGIMSDLHIGSRYEAEDELKAFTKACKKSGVRELICAGDITDGLKMHPGMEHEQYITSTDQFLDEVVEKYPKGFDKSYFITGNHDDSFRKQAGVDIGRLISHERRDLTYVGRDAARVELPGGLQVQLYHGAGSCGQNRSMRLQRYTVSLAQFPGDMPHIIVGGHCHQLNVTPNYMKCMLISSPGFQHTTPYLHGKGLCPDIGGIILNYEIENGRPTKISTEFVIYEAEVPNRKL